MKRRPPPKKNNRKPRPTPAAAMKRRSSISSQLTLQLEQVSLQNFFLEGPAADSDACDADTAACDVEEKDCILSQDFFCTPDYITPDGQQILNCLDFDKENVACPKSPEKSRTVRSKRHRKEGFLVDSEDSLNQQVSEQPMDSFGSDSQDAARPLETMPEKKKNYISPSVVALRCRVMPPPCIKNPYLTGTASMDMDLFDNRRSKSSALFTPVGGDVGDGLSRYRTDFHEIEQIGCGNFSRVFKVLKRIDGCLYAVKHSIRQLRMDTERRHALMEVQALSALGPHENIVGYYSSWFENEQLYIQMELCDHSLSTKRSPRVPAGEALDTMYQIVKALQFMHERGIAHLDVKPDNIYVKNGVYKLGDFGCATLLDRSLPIEEGDARYMPREILNDTHEHLDKVDIFSLGATIYELVKGSPLPESGPQFSNLREGKITLLPGYPMQIQSLLKVMMDPDPIRRPSAKEIVENSIFDRARTIVKAK